MQTFEITFYEEKRLQTVIQAVSAEEARQKFLTKTQGWSGEVLMAVGEPTIEIENIKPLEARDVRANAH